MVNTSFTKSADTAYRKRPGNLLGTHMRKVSVMSMFDTALFGAVKTRIAWSTQRQEILAQNIANANTPNYRARDLRAFDFGTIVRQQNTQLNMVTTNANHEAGSRKRIRDFSERAERVPYETTPDGNAVVLEEQLTKLSETSIAHQLAGSLYKKHMQMLKMALGRGR